MPQHRGSIRARRPADLPALAEGLALVAAADGYPSRWPDDPVAWLRADPIASPHRARAGSEIVGA